MSALEILSLSLIYDYIVLELSFGMFDGTDCWDTDIGDGSDIEVDGCWRVDV